MSVRVGYMSFTRVESANDQSSYEATEAAKKLRASGFRAQRARVERIDGLVLLAGPMESWTPGVHFKFATCGHRGSGPIATAEILALFGFGDKASLMQHIRRDRELTFDIYR